eukprot:scaffold17346_cov29-Tisochrysis_lutea.AAC.1
MGRGVRPETAHPSSLHSRASLQQAEGALHRSLSSLPLPLEGSPSSTAGAAFSARGGAETASTVKYRRLCERVAIEPEPLLLRTLSEPSAHDGAYSTADAQQPMGEEAVAAIVASVDAFVGVRKLRLVNLKRPPGVPLLSRDAVEVLARCVKVAPSLTLLDLSHNALDDPTAAQAIMHMLHGNTRLRSLILRHNQLGQHAAKAAFNELMGDESRSHKLRELDLSCNPPLAKWRGQATALNKLLRSNTSVLCLGVSIGGGGVFAPPQTSAVSRTGGLQVRPVLRGRDAAPVEPARVPPVLTLLSTLCRQPERLRAVRLVGEALPSEAVLRLCDLLRGSNTLTELDVSHGYVRDEGAMLIGKALQENQILVRLG